MAVAGLLLSFPMVSRVAPALYFVSTASDNLENKIVASVTAFNTELRIVVDILMP